MRRKLFALISVLILSFSLVAFAGVPDQAASEDFTDTASEEIIEVPDEEKPSSQSNIISQADVPMLVLNNGVEMPQLGQIENHPFAQRVETRKLAKNMIFRWKAGILSDMAMRSF